MRGDLSNPTQYASWIDRRYAVVRHIFGQDATRADGAVATNSNPRENYHVRANPHAILDHNWCGGQRRLTLLDAMLVPINDAQVVTKQTMASDGDFSVCRDRRSVVDEGVIAIVI